MKLWRLTLIIILCLIVVVIGFCLDAGDLATMDYAFEGQPFVDVSGKSSIDLTTMDYAFQGQPFVSRIDEEVPSGITWNGVTITKWNGITITIPLNTQ